MLNEDSEIMNAEDCGSYTKWQHEREMTRVEMQAKRWFIAFLIVLFMLFGTNLAWVIYEMQFQEVSVTQTAEGDDGGNATIYSGTGDVSIGEGDTDDPDPR